MSKPDLNAALAATALKAIREAREQHWPDLAQLETAYRAHLREKAIALLADKPNVDEWTASEHMTFLEAEQAGLFAAPAAADKSDELPF